RHARSGHQRTAGQPRGSVPALPLSHDHELRRRLSEGPQPDAGDRQDQGADGPAHRLRADPGARTAMERGTRDRLQWKCRRGLLELDLVLSQFLKRQVPEMSAADLAAFNELLDYPDTELWDFGSGGSERFDPRFGGVMSRLRTT